MGRIGEVRLTSPGANNSHARRLFDHLVGAGEDQLRHRQAERLRGLKVVGDFGGEGANASGLVDDYRAGTEWFFLRKSYSATCRLPSRPLHGHEQCIQPTEPEIKNLVPTSSAGHAPAGAKADAKLTFHPDNQARAGQEGTVMAHFCVFRSIVITDSSPR